MFEKEDQVKEVYTFLEDDDMPGQFGIEFADEVQTLWPNNRMDCIKMVQGWGPHISLECIRLGLEEYFVRLDLRSEIEKS